jgi:hypothetical protein
VLVTLFLLFLKQQCKPVQARYVAEIEALNRSLEQREKSTKDLLARIRELEDNEAALNRNFANQSLRVRTIKKIKFPPKKVLMHYFFANHVLLILNTLTLYFRCLHRLCRLEK